LTPEFTNNCIVTIIPTPSHKTSECITKVFKKRFSIKIGWLDRHKLFPSTGDARSIRTKEPDSSTQENQPKFAENCFITYSPNAGSSLRLKNTLSSFSLRLFGGSSIRKP
jgi:hypothetical protein